MNAQSTSDFFCDLGRNLTANKPFRLSDDDLGTHVAVVGATGSGKSRLLNKLACDHIDQGRGIAIIEPGDLCDDVAAYYARLVVETGNKNVLKRIHRLRAEPGQCFRYDPFRFRLHRPVHPELLDSVRRSWVHCKVQSVAEVFQAKATGSSDFEGQPRLQRILTDTLYFVAEEVHGRRLPLGDAQILLDLTDPLHQPVYANLHSAGRLPREVVGDFEILHSFKRVEELRRETESSVNRYRSLLSPLMKSVLSGNGQDPSVDLFSIIQRGECMLLPVQEDQFFSHDQKVALTMLILHDLIETLITTPRELRRDFTIVIDEGGEFLSDRLMRALGMMRKHRGRFVISGQDLSTFRKKDGFDMTPKLLSQCGTVICFNQKWPEDTDILARVLYSGNLQFNWLEHEVERHGGYEWLEVTETSETFSKQLSVEASKSQQQSLSLSHQDSAQSGTTNTQTVTKSSQTSVGHTAGQTNGQGASVSNSVTQQPVMTGTDVARHVPVQSGSQGANTTSTQSTTNTVTHVEGQSTATGTSHTMSQGTTDGTSVTDGTGTGTSEGVRVGAGHSESLKKVPLGIVTREAQKTGSLEKSVSDQLEVYRKELATKPKRHATVKVPGETAAFEIHTVDVPDPFVSPEAQAKAIEWFKRELPQVHDYFFTPDLSADEDERRIRRFLGEKLAVDMPMVAENDAPGADVSNGKAENPYGV